MPKTEDLQFGTPQISYFTNRILIGDTKEHAVITKLCEANNVLGSVSECELKESQKVYEKQNQAQSTRNNPNQEEEIDSYCLEIAVKVMDSSDRTFDYSD